MGLGDTDMTAFLLGLYILVFPVAAAVVLAVIVRAAYREFRAIRDTDEIV